MTPERWQQVERLYHLAAAQEVSQRATFLEEACHGDEAMRQEIESLLAHEEPANKFMEAPGMAVLAQAVAQDRAGSMIGRQLGPYQILSLLGAGGMGEVYQARDTRLGRLVALKILPPGVAADPERKRRLLQEAKAASALNHPHIVTLHDVGSEDGVDFLVMEYVQGNTLDKLIPRGGLDLTKALSYAIEIADAFAKAHAAGIIHRDLKPGNIMVTEDGAVKVLDFGIAKLIETLESSEPADIAQTKTATEGTILGTAAYMSPEQAEGKKVDARTDIFSFGALLYEMVTGERAFQGDSKISTMSAVLHDEPKAAGQTARGLPAELERIIARCPRKDPERRFQTMADLKAALIDVRDGLASGALSRRRKNLLLAGALALLGALAAGAAILWFVRSIAKAPEPVLTAAPLTTYPGFQSRPSCSPDGNQVAFSWDGEKEKRGNSHIYVKLIGTTGSPLRLTTADDYSPTWSPDGRFIAFLRALSSGKQAVMVTPALGGSERKIGEIWQGDCPAWSPDGNWLAISQRDSAKEPFALYLLSVDTGEQRRMTSPAGDLTGDTNPAFSPDERYLAFSRARDYGLSDLYVVVLSDRLKPLGAPRQITYGRRGAEHPAWTADGREIIYAAGTQVPRGLWRVAVSGRSEPQRLASLGDSVSGPAISHDGRRLAYVHTLIHQSIWRMTATTGAVGNTRSAKGTQPVNQATPLISSTRDDEAPEFSPAGKKIAFHSKRSGSMEVWVCDADGSNAAQVTSFGGPDVTTPRWSPDGERIAFDSNAGGEYDVYVVGAGGGKPQRMTSHPANDGNPSWSHDGRSIYFDSARTGEQQVWKIPANGGEALQITHEGGVGPRESPDGRFLYYTKALSNSSLWRIPVAGGTPVQVLENVESYNDLAIVDKGIYFITWQRGAPFQFLRFDTGTISPVGSVKSLLGLGLTISPDGKSLLYTQFDQSGSELMLVENFH